MKRQVLFAIMITLVLVGGLLSACKKDKEDKKQTQQAQDALKNLDASNQANRANQTIPNKAPQVTILAPAIGTVVTTSPLEVSWTITDENKDKIAVDVSHREIVAGAAPGEFTVDMPVTTPDPGKFSLDVSNFKKPGDFEIQVRGSDGSLSNVAFARFRKE